MSTFLRTVFFFVTQRVIISEQRKRHRKYRSEARDSVVAVRHTRAREGTTVVVPWSQGRRARGRAGEGYSPSSVNDTMESSPLGTGDFAVNAGFAALTLDTNDAKAQASPLTPRGAPAGVSGVR